MSTPFTSGKNLIHSSGREEELIALLEANGVEFNAEFPKRNSVAREARARHFLGISICPPAEAGGFVAAFGGSVSCG